MQTEAPSPDAKPRDAIGVFDSGVGGLSVLRALHAYLPHERFLYLGDQAHVPYGGRSPEDLRAISEGITRFFLTQGVKMIVIACNTASAAALKTLRADYPQIPFVGMEPAVKPAAEQTLSGKVGVLATSFTLQGALYASVVERFAQGVQVYQAACPGLVTQVEAGALNSPQTRDILEETLTPMLAEGVDTLVMGCTHFPFLIPLIEEISDGRVRIIDPAPSVAKQVGRVLEQRALLSPRDVLGNTRYLSTASVSAMQASLQKLLGVQAPVEGLVWQRDVLSFRS